MAMGRPNFLPMERVVVIEGVMEMVVALEGVVEMMEEKMVEMVVGTY